MNRTSFAQFQLIESIRLIQVTDPLRQDCEQSVLGELQDLIRLIMIGLDLMTIGVRRRCDLESETTTGGSGLVLGMLSVSSL